LLELLDALSVDARRGRHLLERHLQAGRRLCQVFAASIGIHAGGRLLEGRLFVGLAGVRLEETLLDHLQREVLVALEAKDGLQTLDVVRIELAVAGRCALGCDQSFGLQEPDLRDRDVGELGLDVDEDLSDRLVVARAGHALVCSYRSAAKNVSLNLPI
jgi:hypothetical protein